MTLFFIKDVIMLELILLLNLISGCAVSSVTAVNDPSFYSCGANGHCTLQEDRGCSPAIRWSYESAGWDPLLFLGFECNCGQQSRDPSRDQSIVLSIRDDALIAGSFGGVVSFTSAGHTLDEFIPWNKVTEQNNGCGTLCQRTTPTPFDDISTKYGETYARLEMMINVTVDLIGRWSHDHNEIHIIVISNAIDNDHTTKIHKIDSLITKLIDVIDRDKVSLHYIVNSQTLMKYLGNPQLQVMYSDHTHVNPALTLNNLIQSTNANNVQGHCLSRGISFKLNWYTDTLNGTLNPSLWRSTSLNVQYTDRCLSITDGCPGYCSPLHGCITDAGHNMAAISNEKPSLADVIFRTNHGEYDAVIDDGEVSGASHQLSVEQTVPEYSIAPRINLSHLVVGEPQRFIWDSSVVPLRDVIDRNEPLLIKSLDVLKWPAISKWNMTYIADNIGLDVLPFVKCSDNYLTFDPDTNSPLKIKLSLPYIVKNMTKENFFQCVEGTCNDGFKGYYYFGQVPQQLKADIQHNSFLYNTDEDVTADKQYIWISSAGMITHGHFDQDHNLFIQLVGVKRFTLWPPSQHELMYQYPRVHPMWHKSRINFRDVNLNRFPSFAKSRALQVTLEPGESLYIPPYTWHYVETLSPSVSLSTWSHDYHMYYHMNTIYGHDHKFDLINSTRGQMFALRLYLDLLIQDLQGFNYTTKYFAKLLATRFTGLENLFPPEESDPTICDGQVPGQIPTCYHVHGFVKLDVSIIGEHFKALKPEVMDVLLMDYIEEISCQVVGVKKLLAFFRYCFQGQPYYVTSPDDEEHSLWD
jgi:hypothetical protein